jgi:LPXTG-site transpeptidase (sortase) family protein
LEKDDIIEINYQGKTYRYKVINIVIIEPENTSVYKSQSVFEDSNSLTLQTCYPRGTTQKRLIVTAKGVD